MERKIFFIGLRKFYSKKKDEDFYVVDYVDIKNTPQSDYISLEEFNNIAKKTKGREKTEVIGIFDINQYNKIYLTDIKA